MNFYDEFQFFYAAVALLCGVVCAAVYQIPAAILAVISKKTIGKILAFIIDLLWMCLSAVFCFYVFFKLNFPQIRLYMIVSVFAGMWIYYETFNIFIAFLFKLVYNKIIKVYKNFKRPRRKSNEQSAKRQTCSK